MTEVLRTRWSSEAPDHIFEVHQPATGEVLARVAGADTQTLDSAVQQAQKGFEIWRQRSARERGKLLRQVADHIRAHADEIADLECAEVGKPRAQARSFDLEICIGVFDYFGSLIGNSTGTLRDSGPILDLSELTPYGVVGGILPFNWPPIHTAGKIAPALAVGNSIVIKPPEQAPLTIMRIVELINEVIEDDVVHVVPGGPEVGAALAGHPLISKLSFTGAPSTGARVLKSAADNLTPTLMELGGKNPLIVFGDADFDKAVGAAVEGAFFNQGEACTAASRILVDRRIHDRFVKELSSAVSRLVVGDGADERTHVGPLVTRAHQQRVLDYIRIGVDEGATIAVEAQVPTNAPLDNGYFVAPTVFADVAPSMRIAQEEIFGPVVVVIPFDTEADAVEIANGTEFGLVAGVFTADHDRSIRVARQIEAGLVFVNHYNRAAVGVPFGGTKHSGYGREHTEETLHEFGYTRTIRMPSGTGPIPRWSAVDQVTRSNIG
jgi:betaine-aldehyde dehydrogenase